MDTPVVIRLFADKRLLSKDASQLIDSLHHMLPLMKIFWSPNFLSSGIYSQGGVIAARYSIPIDSIRIYGYYPRRFIDLLRRYGGSLKKDPQNDAPLKSLAERTNLIANWLARPAKAPGMSKK